MIRRNHILYDLRNQLVSFKMLATLLVIGSYLFLFVSANFVYLFALLAVGLFTLRGLIGRRCPRCDGPLHEEDAERDAEDAFIMYIIWRCPRDDYEEREKIKGSGGLFGVD